MPLPSQWTNVFPTASESHRQRALERQNSLTKPRGSLGQLEALAVELAALQKTDRPGVDPSRIAVFAADHGVCEEGVSAYPQEVTAQMIANFAHGGAAISVLARQQNAALEVINLGTVMATPDLEGVLNHPIGPGTANSARQTAMTRQQLDRALAAGDDAAARAHQAGCRLFIGGDMGIGNTTSATAVACALLQEHPDQLVGPGTGLDPDGVRHKRDVIQQALTRHGNEQDALTVMASLGGFEIAGLTGALIGCASRGIPVLVDGFIVSVAALVAVSYEPAVRPWLLFAHQSAEPGHQRILQALDANPLLDIGMRLGEGSGAAVALSLLRTACALHNDMASFADAGVSDQ